MSMILNIDTATDTVYISIAKGGELLAEISNKEQKDHGSFLHPAIHTLLKDLSVPIQQLDAVAVASGPGSYTGLRVGMAAAKGLCYALNKPLIIVNTLEILAFAAIIEATAPLISAALLCPMIDARRMEVFTAIYDPRLQPVLEPCAMVLDPHSFANNLLNNQMLFFGSGAKKWKLICTHKNAVFIQPDSNSLAMSKLAFKKYELNGFADLAYSEPLYLKEFFGLKIGD